MHSGVEDERSGFKCMAYGRPENVNKLKPETGKPGAAILSLSFRVYGLRIL